MIMIPQWTTLDDGDYVDIVDELNEEEWNELWDTDDDPDLYDVKETCDG
jgi:hypothetical protein